MPQSLGSIQIHIVFSTKYRTPFITDEIEESLFRYFKRNLQRQNCLPIEVGGFRDHVHLLLDLHRSVSVSQLVCILKTISAKWVKSKGVSYLNFAWQNGYSAFSVSKSRIPELSKYIRDQKVHHQSFDFKEEHRSIFRSHDLEFDEKYVWD